MTDEGTVYEQRFFFLKSESGPGVEITDIKIFYHIETSRRMRRKVPTSRTLTKLFQKSKAIILRVNSVYNLVAIFSFWCATKTWRLITAFMQIWRCRMILEAWRLCTYLAEKVSNKMSFSQKKWPIATKYDNSFCVFSGLQCDWFFE